MKPNKFRDRNLVLTIWRGKMDTKFLLKAEIYWPIVMLKALICKETRTIKIERALINLKVIINNSILRNLHFKKQKNPRTTWILELQTSINRKIENVLSLYRLWSSSRDHLKSRTLLFLFYLRSFKTSTNMIKLQIYNQEKSNKKYRNWNRKFKKLEKEEQKTVKLSCKKWWSYFILYISVVDLIVKI